ncbi:MAG: hypothetical protein AVDCRST_MAG65-2379, partial [uncultured Solirubrobacteraceae bacterium]
ALLRDHAREPAAVGAQRRRCESSHAPPAARRRHRRGAGIGRLWRRAGEAS